MARYRDKSNCKHKATVSKRVKGETKDERHERRLRTAFNHKDELRAWCIAHGATFKIHNEGMHWQIKIGKMQFDWWPISAKLIINQKWQKGIHVHDYKQLIKIIQEKSNGKI
jgi:hypothetical protein